MSEESKFQTKTYLDSLYNFYAREVSKTRNVSYTDFLEISDDMKVRTAEDAVKFGLISATANYDRVEGAMKQVLEIDEDSKKKLKFVSLSKYIKAENVIEPKSSKNRIAVIVGDGAIISGEGSDGYIGGHRIAKQIKKAREDKKVKAIVLRINSPGGSALASDVMWREVMLTKGVKPIIASMSDVAASGGYYMAMACDTIVAMPNTITGSIGIFATLFEAEQLFKDQLGITFDEVSTGTYSNLGSPTNAFTDGERAVMQAMIEEGYDNFTKKAAQGRGMTQDELKKVAEGRVWIGAEAQKIGLVDVLGDFNTALEVAAKAADLEEDDFKIKFYGPKKPKLFGDLPFEASSKIKEHLIREELGEFYEVYKNVQRLRHLQGVQALMPFEVVIR
ncbi:MAG: signal peptide peptidase SppA, partial [Flammeovirgaceae bacterium]